MVSAFESLSKTNCFQVCCHAFLTKSCYLGLSSMCLPNDVSVIDSAVAFEMRTVAFWTVGFHG